MSAPPDLVSAEEKARRKSVVKGWTFRIKDQYDVPFANHCMGYIKGYRDDPPAPYADPQARSVDGSTVEC